MAEEKRNRPSAKDARARMGRAMSSSTPQSRATEPEPETKAEPAMEKERLTRISVDLPQAQHRYLRVMAAESGATGMAVIRALLEESATDEELAFRVRERLAEGR